MISATWIVTCLLALGGDTDDASALTKEQIEQAITQLGDESFEIREQATHKLWEAGDDITEALRAARDRDDPEIRSRVDLLLQRIELGILPNTSPEVATQLARYKSGDPNQRRTAIAWFEARGEFRILRRLALQEDDATAKSQLQAAVLRSAQQWVPSLILDGKLKDAEEILLATAETQVDPSCPLARFYWATGQLEEGIERVKSRLTEKNAPAAANELAALHALREEWDESLAWAKRASDARFVATHALAGQKWAELLEGSKVFWSPPEASALKQLPTEVVIYELLNQPDDAKRAFEKLVPHKTPELPAAEKRLWSTRMLILERFDDAFDSLQSEDPSLYAAMRLHRHEYGEVARFLNWDHESQFGDAWLASLPGSAEQSRESQFDLAVVSARALAYSGRRDDARRVLETLARHPLPDRTTGATNTLLASAALEADQWERYLDFSTAAVGTPEFNAFWQRVSPAQANSARLWQACFESGGFEFSQKTRLRIEQISQLAGIRRGPHLREEDLDLILGEAEKSIAVLLAAARPTRAKLVIDASLKFGRLEQAERVCKQLGDSVPFSFIYLGDLALARGDRAGAAESFGKVWDLTLEKTRDTRKGRAAVVRPMPEDAEPPPAEFFDPARDDAKFDPRTSKLSEDTAARLAVTQIVRNRDAIVGLYLRGHYLGGKRGEELKRSVLAMLPSVDLHMMIADVLRRHGATGEARRILQMVRAVSPLGTPLHANATSQLASLGHDDAEAAIHQWQAARLTALITGSGYTQTEGYVDAPRGLHLAEAILAREQSQHEKFATAVEAMNLAAPGDIRSYEVLYPKLHAADWTTEADEYFADTYEFHRAQSERFPESAGFENQVAWVCAISHRRLDEALQRAEKAVKLAPTESAYLDTLAEVHFHLGDRAQAVEFARQAVKYSPQNAELKRRLAHFEKAELPE